MPSEFCYEYPTRIRKIVIPSSSNSSLFDIDSLTKLPGRYQPFRIPPPSDPLTREIRSERKLPIPKSRLIARLIKRDAENDFDSDLDPVLLKSWPLMDIPTENNVEDVDCDDDDDDDELSEEPMVQRDLASKIIPKSFDELLLRTPPRIHNLPVPTELLELTNTQSYHPEASVSKVWVNPQYESILKRKVDDENDEVDNKKRKTS